MKYRAKPLPTPLDWNILGEVRDRVDEELSNSLEMLDPEAVVTELEVLYDIKTEDGSNFEVGLASRDTELPASPPEGFAPITDADFAQLTLMFEKHDLLANSLLEQNAAPSEMGVTRGTGDSVQKISASLSVQFTFKRQVMKAVRICHNCRGGRRIAYKYLNPDGSVAHIGCTQKVC